MTGKDIEYSRYQNHEVKSNKTVLEVKNLTRSPHYEGIDLSLQEGEILGITGLLGSGRTEFALSLFGLNKPDSGSIVVEGKEFTPDNPRKAIANGIALVPEERQSQGVFMDRTIEDNIASVALNKISDRFGVVQNKDSAKLAEDTIALWNVKTSGKDALVSQLSGGNQQKVALGRWALVNPRILILDSPTVGVDIGSKSEIYEKIQLLAKKNIGIILISDDIPELLANSNRIAVFNSGKIIKVFDEEEVEKDGVRQEIEEIIAIKVPEKGENAS